MEIFRNGRSGSRSPCVLCIPSRSQNDVPLENERFGFEDLLGELFGREVSDCGHDGVQGNEMDVERRQS